MDNTDMSRRKPLRYNHLTRAIALAISSTLPAQAANYQVTEPLDNGTGLVSQTLSWAILQANNNPGRDVIELQTDVTIQGVMKRVMASDLTLRSDATRRTIDGNNQHRPLFIKSGQVVIEDVNINHGRAQGGDSGRGGAGAGLGGGMFVYGGLVRLTDVIFSGNQVIGGQINVAGKNGGGGMFGSGNAYGGGGLFGDAIGNFVNGGYGGYGNYQTPDTPKFGEGGGYVSDFEAALGGFGGGGAYSYDHFGAHGGFGGGGGYLYSFSAQPFVGGDGGFGGGAGTGSYGNNGTAGFGGDGQHAAGLGGGLFIRSGRVFLEAVDFNDNQAQSRGTADGLGGGLYIMHSTSQANGVQQGMPDQLPTVWGCSVIYSNNLADSDTQTALNNDDRFDLADRTVGLNGVDMEANCTFDQEIQLLGNGIEIVAGDQTPDLADGTDFGQRMAGNQSAEKTFVINNTGQAGLVLTDDRRVYLAGTSSGRFTITQKPATDFIPGQSSQSFTIRFLPTSLQTYTDTVVIHNSDLDEPVYRFEITGQGIPFENIIFTDGFDD